MDIARLLTVTHSLDKIGGNTNPAFTAPLLQVLLRFSLFLFSLLLVSLSFPQREHPAQER